MRLVTGPRALLVSTILARCFIYISHSRLGTLVLAGALLEQSQALLDRGIHPIRIADGFDRACKVAVEHLDKISDRITYSLNDTSNLLKTAMTSLGSKMCVCHCDLSRVASFIL